MLKKLLPSTFTVLLLWSLLAPAYAATFSVTNILDSGPGSLRQALLDADNHPGLDTIAFSISGIGVHTIAPFSNLPPVIDPVIIDATTQPGYAGKPLIELDGLGAGASHGLRLLSGGSTVRGLAINRFAGDGIHIEGGGGNFVERNYIGTDPNGTLALGNNEGVVISRSSGNMIGGTNSGDGNLISGNVDVGLYLFAASGNSVQGNFIGTSAAGNAACGNLNHGIVIYALAPDSASSNVIGGMTAGARNVIAGNRNSGIYLWGSGAAGNSTLGNYIGTDLTGTVAVNNGGDGVTVFTAAGNFIGGTTPGSGNLISGNSLAGVNFNGPGSDDNTVQGNQIGTAASGMTALGNGLAGVTLYLASGNQVGGFNSGARNLISGNHQDGVFITTNGNRNIIAGNFVGVNASGSGALGNGFNGITIRAAGTNLIGGTSSGSRNIISGNGYFGVHILGGSYSNSVQGNYIGTDAGGLTAVGNRPYGVRVESAANMIGGNTAGSGNVISGNSSSGTPSAGIYLLSPAAATVIQGNYIGTTFGGMAALGNGSGPGIFMSGAMSNLIGGASSGAGNLISGNQDAGIWFQYSSWNSIQGNLIGTKADGISALGNGYPGVDCDTGSMNNMIGGGPGAGNRIAFTLLNHAGVRVESSASAGALPVNNSVLGNLIYSNSALGIDLGLAAGVTLNDPCDTDSGPNMLQNYPVLTQAVAGNGTGVRGTLNSAPNSTFRLQFFANPACDSPSGYGEGQIYLGEKLVSTDASCNSSFAASLPVSVPAGYAITATATDPAGNTSEFSACVTAIAAPWMTVARTNNQQLTLTWTNNPGEFVLKETFSLSPPITWTPVTNSPAPSGNLLMLTLPVSTATNHFYTLCFE